MQVLCGDISLNEPEPILITNAPEADTRVWLHAQVTPEKKFNVVVNIIR